MFEVVCARNDCRCVLAEHRSSEISQTVLANTETRMSVVGQGQGQGALCWVTSEHVATVNVHHSTTEFIAPHLLLLYCINCSYIFLNLFRYANSVIMSVLDCRHLSCSWFLDLSKEREVAW